LAGTCSNAVEAVSFLKEHPVDLLLLDIQMPQLLRTNFTRTLKNPPKVIFTTAYRKYAVEGFELDAVDYLLKPIFFDRFLKAVNKVLQTDIQVTDSAYQTTDSLSESPNSCLYVRADRKMVKVLFKDILYIEGLNDYVKIITATKTIVTKNLISSLEHSLPKENFIRIHRSYIAAVSKIDSFNAETIQIGQRELPVGRLFKHDVTKLLNSLSIHRGNPNH